MENVATLPAQTQTQTQSAAKPASKPARKQSFVTLIVGLLGLDHGRKMYRVMHKGEWVDGFSADKAVVIERTPSCLKAKVDRVTGSISVNEYDADGMERYLLQRQIHTAFMAGGIAGHFKMLGQTESGAKAFTAAYSKGTARGLLQIASK